MTQNSLETFIAAAELAWGPLTSDLVSSCRSELETLLKTPPGQNWLAQLHADAPESRELHRDPIHGFLLLAHAESLGRYRAPHDHGRGWVMYGLQRGEIRMATYVRVPDANGKGRLVKRDEEVVRPGQIRVFLPGDIHDTRSITGPVTLFRFTDRDLAKEERVTRYIERDGIWTDPEHKEGA